MQLKRDVALKALPEHIAKREEARPRFRLIGLCGLGCGSRTRLTVRIGRDGAKMLDFGLAKPAPKIGPAEATLTTVLTTEGTEMGTPQCMAPEQFDGREADARSDIWAFGALLYEMVTGQKAFTPHGKRLTAIVAGDENAEKPIAHLTFPPHFFDEPRRRAPGG